MSGRKISCNVNTPFAELNTVLKELVSSVSQILGDDFTGAYLQGSFAVGGFDERSDCDFIIVTGRDLSPEQVRGLQTNHKRIFNMGLEWAKHLEGSYFPEKILRKTAGCNRKLWYLEHGHSELVKSTHCNSVVVRWILQEKGVVLSGPEPSSLLEQISTDALRRAILGSIIISGKLILANPEQFNNRFYESFIVLHYCRKLHDLYTGMAGSKQSGAEWAMDNMDRSWSNLIDGAWYARQDPALSVTQPADKITFERTLNFVKEVICRATEMGVSFGIEAIGAVQEPNL